MNTLLLAWTESGCCKLTMDSCFHEKQCNVRRQIAVYVSTTEHRFVIHLSRCGKSDDTTRKFYSTVSSRCLSTQTGASVSDGESDNNHVNRNNARKTPP
jgi:hypothetical protein